MIATNLLMVLQWKKDFVTDLYALCMPVEKYSSAHQMLSGIFSILLFYAGTCLCYLTYLLSVMFVLERYRLGVMRAAPTVRAWCDQGLRPGSIYPELSAPPIGQSPILKGSQISNLKQCLFVNQIMRCSMECYL